MTQYGPEEQSEEITRCPFPNHKEGEMFGVAIPGKIRKRMWIREGDLLIVKPWEFEPTKADIMYRYTKTQASYLHRRRAIPKNLDIF